MSDTPRTDAVVKGEWLQYEKFARQLERELNNLYELLRVANQTSATSDSKVIRLERELNAAKAALSGRTVSCSNCNALAAENAEMREAIKDAYEVIRLSAYPDHAALARLKHYLV